MFLSVFLFFFFFKQKTAYEMRISDWSSDVCSSDLANRLVARFAAASAVSFPDTDLPRAVVTGNPVREEVARIDPGRDRATARAAAGGDSDRHLVLVMGGSLGARRINEAVLAALPLWRERADLAVHHVVGNRDWEEISAAAPADLGALRYRSVAYEDDMPALLAAADVAVCRSGSSTCFELASVGLPSVLVPSPHVTADQQTRNARHLVDAGRSEEHTSELQSLMRTSY